MPEVTSRRRSAQSLAHRLVVPDTAHASRNPLQQARERLELQALALGADHILSQLAADAWLKGVAQ